MANPCRLLPRLAVACICVAVSATAARADGPVTLDITRAVVLAPAHKTGPQQKAVQMLVEEVEVRSRVCWEHVTAWPKGDVPVILVGRPEEVRDLARGTELQLLDDLRKGGPEGYCIALGASRGQVLVLVAGNDDRGVLFGVGRLLRMLRLERDHVGMPATNPITAAPQTPLRGHQLGYRPKTNSYDGWTVALWEQYIRDLVVFGCNAIELIPPRSDDAADSPHFPLPQQRMMVEMSRIANEYGIDVWVWYPALDLDYTNPKTIEFALNEWASVLKQLPRLDAVFVPGGDPGATQPKILLNLLEKQAASIRRFHPKCQMWVSPQGFNKGRLDEFVTLLRREPIWLTGVVHGPQMRVNLAEFRKMVPARYPVRDYPDITHSRHCQYPVPDWDVAFALTEGREVTNPRPSHMARIFRLSRPYTAGFITYSEGCHDDVNKCVWSALGWDEKAEVREILREYARYYIGAAFESRFADGLLALEKNWTGPVLQNSGIDDTLKEFRAMEKSAPPAVKLNWRFQQALYRAYYDACVRARLKHETDLETAAMARLRDTRNSGSLRAMADAEAILDKATKEPVATELRARTSELAEALFQSIRAQLSVERYAAIAVERGASFDGIDIPFHNGGYLKKRFAAIRVAGDEAARVALLRELVNRTDPGPGGFYDDLGDPARQPHLVRGPGAMDDPAYCESSLVGFGFRGNGPDRGIPKEWWTHAETLFDTPLQMNYTGLDRAAAYRVRVVYGRERLGTKIRLTAGDAEVHGPISKPLESLEFDIPLAATAGGELTLSWSSASGGGGTGRGCQVAEVFLLKK
ncbi:MAG: hypothetical protein ACJ8F7_13065 [Gemmataceae bacterium]